MNQKSKSTNNVTDCKHCVYNNFARCGVCFCMLPRCRYQISLNAEKGDTSNGKNI
ncbi:MAG: hypothetical protein KHW79_07315 [Clostridiales bacterium]|nr:hypothetical protein [Clostridiales bacterium]